MAMRNGKRGFWVRSTSHVAVMRTDRRIDGPFRAKAGWARAGSPNRCQRRLPDL
jgi:hypothetical protein